MARLIVALFALIASAAAFAPAASTTSALRPSTARFGYVPDGMSAAQYKDMQAKEAKKKADNKKKGWGAGRTGQELSLTEFQRKRDEKFPNTPGAGHMWAKSKFYSYKDARTGGDAAKNQKRAEERAGFFGRKK